MNDRFWKSLVPTGFIMVLVTLISTAWPILSPPKTSCTNEQFARVPADKLSIHTLQDKVALNGDLCLGIRLSTFFKVEIEALNEAKDALKAARDAVKEADKDANPATRIAAIKTAQERLAKAQEKVKDVPVEKTLTLFIDDKRTPVTLHARVVDPAAQGDWTARIWKLHSADGLEKAAVETWREILRGPTSKGTRIVMLGIADESAKLPRPGATIPITLEIYDPWLLALGGAGLLLIALGVIRAYWNTGLLRDGAPTEGHMPPFSLGRVQMAMWLLLTIAGFIYIWLITGQYLGVVTTGVLTLLGISGASGLVARVIDQSPPPTNQQGQQGVAAPQPANQQGQPGAAVTPPAPRQSQGFFKDVLSDGTTQALHRIQMFVWTLVLGAIFVWSVAWNLSFPVFDNELLILAGIVNGIYLGFKWPEKK